MSPDRSKTSQPTTYLHLVQKCDNNPYYELHLPADSRPHGYLLPSTVAAIPWPPAFHVDHDSRPRRVTVLDSSAGTATAQTVNAAFADVVTRCIDGDLFHVLDGKHSEPFAVLGANYPVYIERFASSLFGITACGACLVAYVKDGDSGLKIWIAKRAAHLYSYPGCLDITVAGGVKAGVSPLETVVQEAMEEASLEEGVMRAGVRACGVVTCMGITGDDWAGEKGLVMPELLYLYEMEVGGDVVPRPHDEEVEGFRCLRVEEVREALLKGAFKPDAACVLVAFFIRHGIITAENERDYVAILEHLHRKLPFPVKPESHAR
ncbi:NUDIX hydrolase domain-like protein [Neohortaea acidophila]|uniref:NUDIX hydrolase domain-like protein n=1 Tax=Neohortaea acidophila TaxID=245834 RepID=A0A6A6PPI6_9PEZI|nr:NUDIX hydrolase domain-like protein [Neohortaea acidophila]KAF2481716.1 NUDIX hydrolase domain-like protein [Neohortaea acidophila]